MLTSAFNLYNKWEQDAPTTTILHYSVAESSRISAYPCSVNLGIMYLKLNHKVPHHFYLHIELNHPIVSTFYQPLLDLFVSQLKHY